MNEWAERSVCVFNALPSCRFPMIACFLRKSLQSFLLSPNASMLWVNVLKTQCKLVQMGILSLTIYNNKNQTNKWYFYSTFLVFWPQLFNPTCDHSPIHTTIHSTTCPSATSIHIQQRRLAQGHIDMRLQSQGLQRGPIINNLTPLTHWFLSSYSAQSIHLGFIYTRADV